MDPIILGLIGVVTVGVVTLVLLLRGRRSTGLETRHLLPRVVAASCVVGAVLAIVGALVSIALALTPTSRVTLEVPLNLRVEEVPLDLRADPSAHLTSGMVLTSPLLSIDGLAIVARLWLIAGHALTAIVIVTLLVVIARFAQLSIAETPFPPRLGRLLIIGGSTLAIGGVSAQFANSIAGTLAHKQLFMLAETAAPGSVYVSPPWALDLWPLGVGIVLIVVAGLIRSGERLQRDTEGLV